MRPRRSGCLFLFASHLIAAFVGISSQGFAFRRPALAAAPRWHGHRSVIVRAAETAEVQAEPAAAEVEEGEKRERDRLVGPDGKTGKQRRAARARQKKKEAKNEGKDGPSELALTFGKGEGSPDALVFYKGAPKKMDHEAVLEKFREAGEVVSLRFWLLGDDSSMGMGVVGYRDAEAAQAAISAFDGAELGGRKLKVSAWKK